MKILENISNGYKRIATGIAIVSFLAIMYFALIPGASVAAGSFVSAAASGDPIVGALVFIKEWPLLWNDTTDGTGNYLISGVSIGNYNISARAQGYVTNTSPITVVEGTNPAKNFTLTPNANMTGIGWINSYNAAGSITSTMASQLPRSYDIGTVFFGQYDSQKDTNSWFSVFLISDVYGTGGNVNITYLYDNGTFHSKQITSVLANGTLTVFPWDSGLLLGKVKIEAENPVAAEKRIVSFKLGGWVSQGIMSVLMPEINTASKDFYGQFDSQKDTNGWFTTILVSDVLGSSTDTDVTINYMYDNGTIFYTKPDKVPANGTLVIFPWDSGQLLGKISIHASNPVVAEKRINYFVPGSWDPRDLMADSMLKPSDASKELIVPIFDSRKDINGWFSVVIISDIVGTGANVNIDYLYPNGTFYANVVYSPILANGSLTIFPWDTNLLYGKMLIHSDNPIVGEARQVNFVPGSWDFRAIMAYNLLKNEDGAKTIMLPQYDSTGEWDAEVILSAMGGASSPVVNYYDGSGAFNKTEYYDILVNGSLVFYPGDVTNGRPEIGRLNIQ